MDGEVFVYIHPIISKSQDGEALNVVTRDIGFPKILISDNVGEHTGPQTEPKECIRCFCIDVSTMET